jgi:RNA polymerase II subunit A small phosphatase-like protein
MNRRLLILDLDETPVFATKDKLARREDFRVGPYFVYRRPGLISFVEFAFNCFKVAVWTSSSWSYANETISAIFQHPEHLEFTWTRERCTRKPDPETGASYQIKDLKKVRRLGWRLEDVVVVDDSPEKLRRNYGNHILVGPFEGDAADNELRKLQDYLAWLRDVPNVRLADKRNWRAAPVA